MKDINEAGVTYGPEHVQARNTKWRNKQRNRKDDYDVEEVLTKIENLEDVIDDMANVVSLISDSGERIGKKFEIFETLCYDALEILRYHPQVKQSYNVSNRWATWRYKNIAAGEISEKIKELKKLFSRVEKAFYNAKDAVEDNVYSNKYGFKNPQDTYLRQMDEYLLKMIDVFQFSRSK